MALLQPGQPVRRGLQWVAWLYSLITRLRLWCYRHGWFSITRLPCRVVSVGNLTVGGTGKTPVVILLAQWLLAKGQRVAILSRGYKRTSTAPHLFVSSGSELLAGPSEAGDEPFLIAQRCPRAIVAVGADRVALGRWVLEQYPLDCIVLDDGFQHVALHRDVDLVLLDATDGAGLDALLPAGRLREPLTGLNRASAIIITRAEVRQEVDAIRNRLRDAGPSPLPTIEVVFKPVLFVSIIGGEQESVGWGLKRKAWLVSGVGNSPSFRRSAESIGVEIVGESAFEDHHHYTPCEIEHIRQAMQGTGSEIVLTTEKDGGKLGLLLTSSDPWWMLQVGAEVVHGEEQLRALLGLPLLEKGRPLEARA